MKKGFAWLLTIALLLTALPACADGFNWITTAPETTQFPENTVVAYTAIGDDYTPRVDNALRAAWVINQTTLAWGETFSFNETVGPRTAERGYLAAVNGRGARVYGGGVAQTASTLYLALLNLPEGSVEFDALDFYGDSYSGDYVESSEHAVLVDYNAEIDFAFTNYAADEMVIEMWISQGYLFCSVSLNDRDGVDFNRPSAPPQATRIANVQIFCGIEEDLLSNIALASGSIYDTTLMNGDVFSFNEIVGPRTWEWGYERAINGRGAEVVGGGVAQVASAVWLGIKELDSVTVIEKSTYGSRYNQTYVENSADAIVTDYNAGTDFAFRYTGTGCITLYTWLDGCVLHCEIYHSK